MRWVLLAIAVFATAVAVSAEDRVAVKASRSGFSPNALTVRKGDVLHLVLTTADGEHCFAVDELRIEKRIVPGKATDLEMTVDRPQTLTFYCCLEPEDKAQRGRLVVTE